ncbi:MAG: UDP-N-acetylmuramate dehydrogenase [Cryobacterium sp.]|nr:UDP-N-acetylmuramate dehydrogenase [Cryobacterium sp.]
MTKPLAELTTLRVGGTPRELHECRSLPDLVSTARTVWESDERWLLLGGGSNLVVADEPFDGSVIHVATSGIDHVEGDESRIRVQAGEPWDSVVAYAVERGLAGVEALSGIPGSAGAAPIQNVGAYGQEVSETLTNVDFLDYDTRELERLSNDELGFGYRTSVLKRGRKGVVVGIELQLEPSTLSRPIAYAQLATSLGVSLGDRVPLAEVRDAVLALRASKGMVLSVDDPDSVSAGSFFTNPIVSERFAHGLPTDAPRWLLDPDAPESEVKLSAAWLIERSGITRGFSLPGSNAAISSKHTLAIVNRGGATAEEIMQLARFVHLRVLGQFGVNLYPEPQLVGVTL